MGQLTFVGAVHSCSSPPLWTAPLHKRPSGFHRRTHTVANHLACGRGLRACAAEEIASYTSQQCSPLLHPLEQNTAKEGGSQSSNAFTYTSMKDSLPSSPYQRPIDTNSVTEGTSQSSSAFTYTRMKKIHLGFWDLHQGLETVDVGGKGWIDEHGQEDPLLIAHMLLIANLAADRAAMHTTIATQRDNWNKLFQSSLTAITMTATVLAAMGPGIGHNLSFSLPAFIMDAVAAWMMARINGFQPSQLAEEQRTAARLCSKLCNDIKYSLEIAPQLRQEAQSYLDDTVSKLMAVDRAYPLPLTPMVIQKFPAQIKGPVISKHPDRSKPEIHTSGNGWTDAMSRNMKDLGDLMLESDAKAYEGWARRVENINKCCAVAAPLFAAMAALMNGYDVLLGDGGMEVGAWAAAASALACIASSFSHDAQLGMIFELYRSSIGSFEEMEASIQRTIRLPVEQREHAVIFTHRLAYELGREAQDLPSVPAREKTASNLF